MKNLVLGSRGLVGQELMRQLGDDAIGPNIDITDAALVKQVISDARPSVIYLAAAMTNVDACEQNPIQSFGINVEGVANVVRNAKRSRVVFFSTDYIFDGEDGPYALDAIPAPITHYGRHKLQAEHYVTLHADDWVIVRTTQLYGPHWRRKNFVYSVIDALSTGKVYRAATDQMGIPTHVADLVKATLQAHHGLHHFVGHQEMSRFMWACAIAREFKLPHNLVQPVLSAELNQVAARPKRGGLITNMISVPLDVRLREMASVI